MNLFDKRNKVYQATKDLLFRMIQFESFPNDFYKKFINTVNSGVSIFDNDIIDNLKEFKLKSAKLNSLKRAAEMHGAKPLDRYIRTNIAEREKLSKWFYSEFETIETRFENYLNLQK